MKAAFEPLLVLLEKAGVLRLGDRLLRSRLATGVLRGAHYARLKQIKRRYDPEGLFFVYHSVSRRGLERGRVRASYLVDPAILHADVGTLRI